jgi:ribosomal protein S18 acetylase RimI-like enzyme
MNNSEKFISSIDKNDLEKAMRIVVTFGANEENLIKIKAYIANEFCELGDNRNLYFLEKDNEIVGMVQLILKNADGDPELANGKDIVHVHALQISKHHHRKGYGYHLMQLLEKEAKSQGILKLTLGVDGDNEKALGLYSKLGYSILKETEGRTSGDKLFYMQKNLNN